MINTNQSKNSTYLPKNDKLMTYTISHHKETSLFHIKKEIKLPNDAIIVVTLGWVGAKSNVIKYETLHDKSTRERNKE